MSVREVSKNDINSWLDMRSQLWPNCPNDEHLKEINEILLDIENKPVFVVEKDNEIIGFIEASIHQYAPGCNNSPVGFIEGLYVKPNYRNCGIGKKLIEEVEMWSYYKGFKEVASDAEIDNKISILVHQKLGYKIVETINDEVKFVKGLNK